MSEQAFEKWYLGEDCKSSLNRNKEGHYVYAPAHTAWIVWQAAKADNASEIAELKSQINVLREALEKCKPLARYGLVGTKDTEQAEFQKYIESALSTTPAQSLQAHDNEVIEECAKLFETKNTEFPESYLMQSAKAIRELKGKHG